MKRGNCGPKMIGIGHKIDMILEIRHVFLFFWYYPYVESDN